MEQEPDNAHALNNIGFTKIKLEKYDEAIIDFSYQIKTKGDFAYPYNNRGFCYLKNGELAKAIADIDRSLEIDPENAFAHKNKFIEEFYLTILTYPTN